jgi:hypothetical protein
MLIESAVDGVYHRNNNIIRRVFEITEFKVAEHYKGAIYEITVRFTKIFAAGRSLHIAKEAWCGAGRRTLHLIQKTQVQHSYRKFPKNITHYWTKLHT